MRRITAIAAVAALTAASLSSLYIIDRLNESSQAAVAGSAPVPPMGWNSYNSFGGSATDSLVRQIADAMVNTGMRDAGYKYVNIDDGWQGSRDSNGVLQPNYSRFPNGIKSLADYVHGKGLKFGIYTTPTAKSCMLLPSTGTNVAKDVSTFASWGVDYIKLDWCGGDYSSTGAANISRQWQQAIDASGRAMVLSINAGANSSIAPWASGIVTAWRSGDDICASWKNKAGPKNPAARDCFNTTYHSGIYDYIYSNTADNAPYVSPGHYADADMLEVGNAGLSFDEAKTHFSMWAMWASPLLAGNDLRAMNGNDDASRILLNRDVIAVNQDSKVTMGRKLVENSGRQVWTKSLANGSIAVALINTTDSTQTISTSTSAIGLGSASSYSLRDLWSKATTSTTGTITASVPAHGTVMYTVSGGSATSGGSTGSTGSTSSTGVLRSSSAGRCLDVPGAVQAAGTASHVWDCYGGVSNQQWATTASGELRVYGNKCLDVPGKATTAGTAVQIWDCNGGTNQQWVVAADGSIRGVQSGLCLDVKGNATANGTPVIIWPCSGTANQRWSRS